MGDYSPHRKRWYEVNASSRGASHFRRHYGPPSDNRAFNPANYFDIEVFKGYKKAEYTNPRTEKPDNDGGKNEGYPVTSDQPYFLPQL